MVDEPKPDPANRSDNDGGVFLAPRVVDQRAFDSLARALRGLLDDVRNAEASLRAATEEAGPVVGRLSAVGAEHDARLEKISRFATELSRRTAEAQTLNDALCARADDLEREQRRLDEKRRSLFAELDKRSSQLGEAASESEAAAERAREAAERATAAADRLDDAHHRAERLLAAAQSDENAPLALVERAERLLEKTERAHRELDGIRDQADRVRKSLCEALLRAAEATDHATDHGASIEAAIARAEAARKALETAVENAERPPSPPVTAPAPAQASQADGLDRRLAALTDAMEAISAALARMPPDSTKPALRVVVPEREPGERADPHRSRWGG